MPMYDGKAKQQRITELGVIRLGTAEWVTKNGKRIPTKVKEAPCYVLHDAPKVAAAYKKTQGNTVTRLSVYMPMPEIHQNLVGHHELWGAGFCKCRGDGQRIIDMLSPDNVQRVVYDGVVRVDYAAEGKTFKKGDVMPCPGMAHDLYARCKGCSPSSILFVMVREDGGQQLVGNEMGYYLVHTGSRQNYDVLEGQLMYALDLAEGMGKRSLQGIPMILKRVQRRSNWVTTDPQTGEQYRTSGMKWFLDLEFDLEWVKKAQARRLALAMGEAVPMLPESIEGEIMEGDE